MSKIIDFPTQQTRDWAATERALIPILQAAGIPQHAHAELLGRMKAFAELLNMQLDISIQPSNPADIERALDRLTIALNERSKLLIVERLNREIDVLRARRTQ